MEEEEELPFVSVCTPTFNRRPFIESMFQCFRNQTYPLSRMEWIIVDDGTDKIQDLVEQSGISQIKYFPLDQKMKLGEKRNFMHSKTTGSILVYMDDDDYYPPERVDHAVDMLRIHKTAMIAGASEIYIYFKHIQKMYKCGPYGEDHATAGTFAFRRQLLNETQYDENACLAEEKVFLKNFTVPMVQLDPLKTILVFSHIHNTFDKRNMLENMHPQYFSESTKTVDDFIRQTSENNTRQFFMNDIDDKLKDYQPGEPVMKPDVLEQIAEINEHRSQIMASQPAPQIMIDISGEERRPMTPHEIVKALSQQQEHIKLLTSRIRELENLLSNQNELDQNTLTDHT
jgi:glycosyltransferase involved in cell wall biosynthesis